MIRSWNRAELSNKRHSEKHMNKIILASIAGCLALFLFESEASAQYGCRNNNRVVTQPRFNISYSSGPAFYRPQVVRPVYHHPRSSFYAPVRSNFYAPVHPPYGGIYRGGSGISYSRTPWGSGVSFRIGF